MIFVKICGNIKIVRLLIKESLQIFFSSWLCIHGGVGAARIGYISTSIVSIRTRQHRYVLMLRYIHL